MAKQKIIAPAVIPSQIVASMRLGEVADAARVHPKTIMNWVRKGVFPPPANAGSGRRLLWRPEVVRGWLEGRTGGGRV